MRVAVSSRGIAWMSLPLKTMGVVRKGKEWFYELLAGKDIDIKSCDSIPGSSSGNFRREGSKPSSVLVPSGSKAIFRSFGAHIILARSRLSRACASTCSVRTVCEE